MFFVLGCLDDVSEHGETNALSGIESRDSGPMDTDTGEGDDPPPTMEPLSPAAIWISDHPGYGTGGAFADIDQDGDLDLVVAHGNDMSPGHLTVFENRQGRLDQHPSWMSRDTAYYGHLDVGDVNGDGFVDVVVSRFLGDDRFDEPGGVEVFLNRSGILEDTPSWIADGFFSFSLSLGDMDRDGALDLAVAVGESYENPPDHSRVFKGNGDGSFGTEPVWVAAEAGYSFDVVWADFDGDGWLDLAFANQQAGHAIYQNLEGEIEDYPAWRANEAHGPYEGNTIVVGDVDGDEILDLVVSDNDQQGGVGEVRLWCGPEWEPCHSISQPFASAVGLFDWDGDSDLDLVYGGWWSSVSIVENVGGMLQPEPVWRSTKSDIVVEALDWADVDGQPGLELMVTDWTESSGNRVWSR